MTRIDKVLFTVSTRQASADDMYQIQIFKNSKIQKFGDDIQIHHEKCIEISTNMPSIGSEIPEIAFEISEFLRKSKSVCMANPMAMCKVFTSSCTL